MNVKSKKLTGNGRWESSRMMLPEHREQLLALRERDQAQAAGASTSLPASREELQLMHDYVLFPMAITIAERNRFEVEQKARSLRPLFVKAADIVLQRMNTDNNEIKQKLKRAGIVVNAEERVDGIASYRYNCRGHNGAFAITRDYARTGIGTIIARYIRNIFNK